MESLPLWLNPDRLVDLLRRQRDLYARLRDLSERQRNLITGDRPEMLLNILRDRQELITALAGINERLSPFRRDWDGIYSRLPQETSEIVSALLREINEVLGVILKTDDEDSKLLAARKQMAAASLSGMVGGAAANQAYARHTGPARPSGGT